MTSSIRALEMPESDLASCNVSRLVRSFAKLEEARDPRLTQLRGTAVILFPSVDADPRPNYLIPEVRAFIGKLYQELPHFLYYLAPDPALGAIGMHALCLLPESDLTIANNSAVPRDYARLATLMADRLQAAAQFARRIGDDPAALVSSFRSCVPDEYWRTVSAVARS